ncbi:MAG: response regulator [Melioribacteraceae bacterium]|nr:response regulator [Melioribacteraceae bacterium]
MKRILVVEDDSVLRENITVILREEYAVVDANDGSKAISILDQDQKFDLILSDIMMPKIDGYGLYDYTKKSEVLSDIPFIFLTARADNSSIRKGMNLGVDDYITKPFAIDDLLDGISARFKKRDNEIRKFEYLKNNISLFIPHELRTPLVSILGHTELIENYFDELSKKELLEMNDSISRAGKRLKRSIEKFLKFAELTIQNSTGFNDIEDVTLFDPSQNDCENALNSCYDCLKRIEDISFELNDSKLIIPQIEFETIMIELVSNACKFSEEDSPILVTGEIVNDEYVISVADKGRGIASENINKIDSFVQFDRGFYQQDGNGIGLAIVKLICKKYNVKFSISSEIGKSTTVTLRFAHDN